MFHPASWLAIYDGLGLMPERVDPAVQGIDPVQLRQGLWGMRDAVADMVERTTSHDAFLARFGGVSDPKGISNAS